MDFLLKLSSRIFPSEPRFGNIGSIELNIWLAQVLGVPLLGFKKETMHLKVLLVIYGILLTSISAFIYTGFEIYEMMLCFNDLDALTENLCVTLSHVAGLIKTTNIFYHYKDLHEVIEQLKSATEKYIKSNKQRNIFFRGELENKLVLSAFCAIVAFNVFSCVAMLMSNPLDIAGKRFPFRVFLPHWLPYPLQLAFMSTNMLFFPLQIVSLNCLHINLMNQIRFHLKILNVTFEDLTIDESDMSLKVHRLVRTDGKWVAPHERLLIIIEHHCLLKRIRSDVERIYCYQTLLQFFIHLISLTVTAFQAIVSPNGVILIYCYSSCILSELFLYCWFGNKVIEQSKTLSVSGYNSTWYQFDQNFRKTLLTFLINVQHPFSFTAGGFVELSLQSFMDILRKAYAFVACLQQSSGH